MLTRRRAKQLLVVVIGVLLALSAINSFTPRSSGPASSSYATAADGLAGYAALLAKSGHPVARLRATPAHAKLDPRETLVLLDPAVIVPADISALRTFVSAGWPPDRRRPRAGRVAVEAAHGLACMVRHTVRRRRPRSCRFPRRRRRPCRTATAPAPGATRTPRCPCSANPIGRSSPLRPSEPARSCCWRTPRRFRTICSPHADNAALGLDLAGAPRRPVAFDEGVHGYGQRSGLAALPTRWKWTLVGLLLAALVMVAARIRRLGPVQPPAPPAAPAAAGARRSARLRACAHGHVRAAAASDRAAPCAGRWCSAGRARHRTPTRRRPPRRPLRLGLDPIEVRALAAPALSDDDVLAAGSALAKLSGASR